MIIRHARISDAKEIHSLYRKLRKYELSLLEKDMRKIQLNFEREKTIAEIKRYFKSNKIKIFVAEENSKVAGFIIGEISKGIKNKEGSFDIFVSKNYRGKGVGNELMNELINWFKKRKCKSILVNCYYNNKNAREFYKSLGFKLLSECYKTNI